MTRIAPRPSNATHFSIISWWIVLPLTFLWVKIHTRGDRLKTSSKYRRRSQRNWRLHSEIQLVTLLADYLTSFSFFYRAETFLIKWSLFWNFKKQQQPGKNSWKTLRTSKTLRDPNSSTILNFTVEFGGIWLETSFSLFYKGLFSGSQTNC